MLRTYIRNHFICNNHAVDLVYIPVNSVCHWSVDSEVLSGESSELGGW